jgi:hypothetical protein
MWSITALDLDHWSATAAARVALPSLVRRLVHASGPPLEIDFPAFESVDRPGWDGILMRDQISTPWLPAGASYWEASCRADVARKAKEDLEKRTRETPAEVRRDATFVFVTSRDWLGRTAWLEVARASGDWAAVEAYDANALSQWLETAPAAALWMHSQLGRGIYDLCAPDDLWDIWAAATQPRLPFEIFAEAYEENRAALARFFAASPSRPLAVAADTRGEAAAFIVGSLLFGDGAMQARNCVVVRTHDGLQRLRRELTPPIVVITDPRLETELGDLPQRTWVLVASDRASLETDPEVSVKPLTWEGYFRTVDALGLTRKQATALDQEAGRRITIIRRRLSQIPQVRRPQWADLPDLTPTLAGLAMAGGWYWETAGDREVLSAIAAKTEGEIELAITRLAMLEDPPIFSVAGAGGVISRHDAFPALRNTLTKGLAERFFKACRTVFGAHDPALDMEPDKRWMANIYGKDRPHSGRLRKQLAGSLAFLASTQVDYVAGADLRSAAQILVSELLEDDAAWLRVRDVLPEFAEAAPRAFLDAATRCLPHEAADRGLWALVKPTDGNGFGESLRLNLIWALERMAPEPAHFARVGEILAALCVRTLDDNLITKPHASLVAMLHPAKAKDEAAAKLQGRVLQGLAMRRPDTAWSVALALIDHRFGGGLAFQDAQPIAGVADSPEAGPANAYEAAIDILLGRALTAEEAFGLIDKSSCLDGAPLNTMWDRILVWQATAAEPDRAKAREAVRRTALWRDRRRGKDSRIAPDPRAREVFDLLQAPGVAGQHAWLFHSSHVQHGSDELRDEKLNWQERQERIEASRKTAVMALWAEGGLSSLVEFARGVGSPETVGWVAAKSLDPLSTEAVAALLDEAAGWPGARDFVAGALAGWGRSRNARIEALAEPWADQPDRLLEILLLCTPEAETWCHVDRLPEAQQADYWRRLTRRAWSEPADDAARACREFLRVERPRAALNQTQGAIEALETQLLVDILLAVAQVAGPETDGLVDPHAIEEVLAALDTRSDADRNQRLQLDFIYVEALTYSERGIAALSKEIAANPEVFVQAICGYYKRDDGTEEPIGPEGVEAALRAASHWMNVLEHCRLSPGADASGKIDPVRLATWMADAAERLAAEGRSDRGLYKIGVILGRQRIELDSLWPPMEVAAVLEPYANESFRSGIEIGILNSRGVHSRDRHDGGRPERTLAEKYRGWRRRLEIDCPNLALAFEALAESYDRHAARHDDESKLERLAVL